MEARVLLLLVALATHPHRSESPRPTPGPENKRRRAPRITSAPLLPVKSLRRERTRTEEPKGGRPPMPGPVPLKGNGTPEPPSSNSSLPST